MEAINGTVERKTVKERRKEIRRQKKEEKAQVRRLRRAGHASKLSSKADGIDLVVVVMVVLFSLFGAAMVFSAGYYQTINTSNPSPFYYLLRQGFFVVTGWALMFVTSLIDYRIYRKFGMFFMALSIGLLVLVLVIGQNVNGAVRWINLGFFRFTPSEFSKIFVILFTSSYLIRDPSNIRTLKGLGFLVLVMAAHFLLIVRQPNLSTAIVIVLIMISIMIVGGLNLFYLIIPAAGAVAGYFYIVTYKTPYHWYQRLTSFMDPFADRQGDGYQVVQGLIALGNYSCYRRRRARIYRIPAPDGGIYIPYIQADDDSSQGQRQIRLLSGYGCSGNAGSAGSNQCSRSNFINAGYRNHASVHQLRRNVHVVVHDSDGYRTERLATKTEN